MNQPFTMTDRQAENLLKITREVMNAPLDDEDDMIGWGDDCLPIFDFAKLDGPEPAALEWVLKGYVPEREVTFFTGEGATGKSLSAQQLATCIASCMAFLGLPTSLGDEGAVLYVTAEEGEDELHRRQRNINRALSGSLLQIPVRDEGVRARICRVPRGRETRDRRRPHSTWQRV